MALPGYIFDPTNGKYYKDDEHGRKIVRQNAIKLNESKPTEKKPHLLSLLMKRELGMCAAFMPAKCIRTLFNNKPSGTELYSDFPKYDSLILKAGSDRMYAVFIQDGCSRVQEVPYLHQYGIEKHFYQTVYSILDVFETSVKGTICYATNSITINALSMSYFANAFSENHIHRNELPYSTPFTIWSCAGNHKNDMYALGLESKIKILRPLNNKFLGKRLRINRPLKFTAMKFNETGDLLFFGTHSGHVGTLILKTKELQINKVAKDYINALVVLDENNFICSTMNNQIMKVDVKRLCPVFHFQGHVSQSGRQNLSVCGLHHLLCCTGSDQTTRVWSLYESKPILEMRTKVEGNRSQALLHHENDRCILYVMEENKMMCYDLFNT